MAIGAPSTPAMKTESRTPASTPGGGPKFKEEKIFVTVRVRPLSKKEQLLKDQVAWECADDHTIVYKSSHERSNFPTSYTFGIVKKFILISLFHWWDYYFFSIVHYLIK